MSVNKRIYFNYVPNDIKPYIKQRNCFHALPVKRLKILYTEKSIRIITKVNNFKPL